MTITPSTSIDNKATKVKRLKEYGYCVFCFSFVWVFVLMVGPYLSVFFKPRKFFITKNLINIYKLCIIISFYYKEKFFAIILVFLVFVTILEKWQRKKKYINK